MRYYEYVTDGCIIAVGSSVSGGEEIPEERYNAVMDALANAPEDTDTTGYRLRTDLTWEPYDIEPVEEDIDEAEAYDIIFGGAE